MSYLNKRNKLLLSKHYKLKFYGTCIKRNKEKKKLLVPQSHWLIEVGAWVHFELTLRKQCTTSETICTNSYCYRVVKTYLIHCNIDWLKSIISSTHYGLYQSQIWYVYKKKKGGPIETMWTIWVGCYHVVVWQWKNADPTVCPSHFLSFITGH